MLMAVIPDDVDSPVPVLSEGAGGVVSYSVPVLGAKGNSADFSPNVSGYDYVVASWGDGSHSTYTLAEKVWMALGLTPRCIGNEEQRLVYDDLGLPEFSVAEGEVSMRYHYHASRPISWQMSNAHLRTYLWMRGARGVRSFFYEARVADTPEWRALMNGGRHIELKPAGDWCVVDLREHRGALLVQVWASVDAVSCQRCPAQTADNIAWPGVPGLVTHQSADSIRDHHWVYLDDRFLEKYEQSSFYDTVPVHARGQWLCSPSYGGQWTFTDCERIGRNIVRVPLRELYKPKPDQEILHAHRHALDPAVVAQADLNEEHVAAKMERLVDELLALGEHLSALAATLGIQKSGREIVGLDRVELRRNGWHAYPRLQRLAQVAPLQMSEQAMLARCKSVHELWQAVPNGFLKQMLRGAGCSAATLAGLGSLKLIQGMLNILQRLDAEQEDATAFASAAEPEDWNAKNPAFAALFVLNDLRIADAHEAFADAIARLQDLGFDTASLQQGHGRAFDFVLDGVISAFKYLNTCAGNVLGR
ncbi:MAG: hypothetical protein Q7K57_08190 [Burkholderiaceae bacterium]|nr:hypothetical protein [Burkholderiaceae bacterium]